MIFLINEKDEVNIKNAIKKLQSILQEDFKKKEVKKQHSNDHKGRLDRQGKDIYNLCNKVDVFEQKAEKIGSTMAALIKHLDLDFFSRVSEKGIEVKFEKKAKDNISEEMSDKRKRRILEKNIDCVINQIFGKRNENN